MKIFVGNLPFSVSEEELHNLFAALGSVVSTKIITDRETGRPRGFAFVEMANENEGQTAIAELDGKDMGGREIRVSEARPQENKFGGGGGGGGGYRDGRGGGGGRDRGDRNRGGGGGRGRY